MIGNAVMDEEADNRGLIDYAWHHAVISDRLYETIKLNCDFSIQNVSRTCSAAVDEYYDVYDIIDMYSLYSPTCARTESTSRKLWKIGGKGPMFLAKLKSCTKNQQATIPAPLTTALCTSTVRMSKLLFMPTSQRCLTSGLIAAM
ncbi:serine carboxypeptidase-like 34 [Iris pallida]|uniref:Serine carboxypeptidase-like 34 n=1 Tax=Iris pallida TaxID=29817 RepID=A0AAX6E526_IRIPA|nr:serine carboxypeptidase-like 34 [Iris pallida]